MNKYTCEICGAGCYSADTTKTICAECVKDGNLVEVVRCEDCVFFQYTAGTPWCNWWRDVIGLLDYCSNGKGGHADG